MALSGGKLAGGNPKEITIKFVINVDKSDMTYNEFRYTCVYALNKIKNKLRSQY